MTTSAPTTTTAFTAATGVALPRVLYTLEDAGSSVDRRQYSARLLDAAGYPRGLEALGASGLPAAPRLAGHAALRASLDAARVAQLEQDERDYAARVAAHLPLAPGEVVAEARIDVLADEWHGLAKGTLALRRRSNLATMVFVLPFVRLLEDGAIRHERERRPDPVEVERHEAERAAGHEALDTVLEASLTLAKFAAVATEAGEIVGGIIELIQLMFSHGKEDLPEIVASAVRDAIVDQTVRDTVDVVSADYAWFRDQYDAAWDTGAGGTIDEAAFLHRLDELLAPDHPLVLKLLALMHDETREAGLDTLFWGASVHVDLLKADYMVKSRRDRKPNASALATLRSTSALYAGHFDTMIALFEQRRTDRLAKVGEPYKAHEWMIGSGGLPQQKEVFRFDDKEDGSYQTVDMNLNGPSDQADARTLVDANARRDRYVADLAAATDKHNYKGEKAKRIALRDQWDLVRARYRKP